MSIETCNNCSRRIDTDFDCDCYVDVGNMRAMTWTEVLCPRCREQHFDQLEQASGE